MKRKEQLLFKNPTPCKTVQLKSVQRDQLPFNNARTQPESKKGTNFPSTDHLKHADVHLSRDSLSQRGYGKETNCSSKTNREMKEESNYSSRQSSISLKGPTSLQTGPPTSKGTNFPPTALATLLFPSQLKLLTYCRCSLELT